MEQISTIVTGIVYVIALISLVLVLGKMRKFNQDEPSEQEKETFNKRASTGMVIGLAVGAVIGLTGLVPTAHAIGAGLLIGMAAGVCRK